MKKGAGLMINLNNRIFKLVFLDTNALREISSNKYNSCQGFFRKFFLLNSNYIPCFSIYNIIELKPHVELYEMFLNVFNKIPSFMFFPLDSIIKEEYKQFILGETPQLSNQIMYAFNPVTSSNNDKINCFFEQVYNEDMTNMVKQEISQFSEVLKSWETQRLQYAQNLGTLHLPGKIINDKYYLLNEKETIRKDLEQRGINIDPSFCVQNFPSLRMIEYSHFKHVHQTKKAIKINDILDIEISGAVPYVDCVITEAFQADVYKKARKFIPSMKSLEVLTLKDVRMTEN